jgi:hypothetical protein
MMVDAIASIYFLNGENRPVTISRQRPSKKADLSRFSVVLTAKFVVRMARGGDCAHFVLNSTSPSSFQPTPAKVRD